MSLRKRIRIPKLARLRRAWVELTEREWRYVPRRDRLRPLNRVTPLRSGERTFPAMLEAIRAAKSHVHLETYMIKADRTGLEFQAALTERARAGVKVRVIYDSLGSFGLPGSFVAEMRTAGVGVVEYHPIVPWRSRWALNSRDHQKILVVDDRVAFTGGINICDDQRPLADGGGGWFDVHARVEGPVVFDLAQIFRKTWRKAGGGSIPEPEPPALELDRPEFTAGVQVISNVGVRTRWQMHRAYVHGIRNAERTISIMNSYFIPDRRLRRAFGRAARRGVDVRVIVPSVSDVRAAYYAGRWLYAGLMRRGVRIFEWPERMMHAKLGVIDGVWSTIGSYNLDRRSLLHNLEVSLVIVDRKIGVALQSQFEADLKACQEIRPAEWQRRSRLEKALEWFFYQLRYWL